MKKDIIIAELWSESYGKSSSWYVKSTDGEEFSLVGRISYDKLNDLVFPGVQANIRYYDHSGRLPVNPVYELTVGDVTVVSYDDFLTEFIVIYGAFWVVMILLASVCLYFRLLWLDSLESMEEKRDARIIKKYGDLHA